MMNGILIAVIVVATFAGPEARGEHVLLPIFVNHLAGAEGSIWSSEFSVHNPTDTDRSFHQICPYLTPCLQYAVPATSTVHPIPVPLQSVAQYPGYDFLVNDSDLEALSLQLRVFEESRGTWGTVVPVVRWSRVSSSKLRFIQIPTAANFRHTVRIYAETSVNPLVVVRYFDDSAIGSSPIVERTLSLALPVPPFVFGFAQLSSGELPNLVHVARIRIEVESTDPAKPIWGMVSVTDTETQEFSLITPE